MFNQSVLSMDMLWIAGRAAILVCAFAMFAWGFMRWRRSAERDTQRVFEQLDLVRADLLIMKEVMQSAAQRVDSAAKQVAHDVRLAPTHNNSGRGYEIAARLARSGAQKEELIKSCGITTHEAELLVRLHGRMAVQHTDPIQTAAAPKAQPKVAVTEKIADIARTAVRRPAAPAPQVRSRLVAVG